MVPHLGVLEYLKKIFLFMTTYLDRCHDLGNPIQILAYIHHQNVFDLLTIGAVAFCF